MKRKCFFFNGLSYVLSLTIICFAYIGNAQQTQLKKWYLDARQIDFTENPPIVENMISLDVPMAQVTTDGATNGIYGVDGTMLLYVDKNMVVYNQYGNVITSLLTSVAYADSGPEIMIVPVPANTCQYYIIYSGRLSNTDGSVNYTVIDLSENDGLGGVIGDLDMELFELSFSPIGGFAIGSLRNNNTRLLYHTSNNNADGEGCKLRKCIIASDGITVDQTIYQEDDFRAFGNVEIELSKDESKIAFSTFKPDDTNSADVYIFHLDNNGNLNTSLGDPGDPGRTSIDLSPNGDGTPFTGCEFSEDDNLLYAGAWGIGIYEVDISNLNNITYQLIEGSEDFGKSQIERAYDGEVYAATSATELRFIEYLAGSNNPTMSNAEINTITPSIIINDISTRWGASVFILPDQLDNADYDEIAEEMAEDCCEFASGFNANQYIVGETSSQTVSWTASSNDFGNTSVVRISGELRIRNNSTLSISGMEFQFAEGAKIVVEVGSRLITSNNTILTSTDCESTWAGIQVWGDNQANQFGANNQGRITLSNTIVEHAVTAVRMYSTENVAASNNKTGGIIYASGTHFLNNARGVQFNRYENTTPSGQHAGNLSYFRDCTFRIDNDYRFYKTQMDGHIKMWGVDGINIWGCTFEHTQDVSTPSNRSYAIRALDAGFNVRPICNVSPPNGPCQVWDRNEFSGFYDAISAQATSFAQPYHSYFIDRATFDGNRKGVNSTAVDIGLAINS